MAQRKSYSLWSKWGWINLWGDIKHQVGWLAPLIWEDTIYRPLAKRKCARVGHAWSMSIEPYCERCLIDRFSADPEYRAALEAEYDKMGIEPEPLNILDGKADTGNDNKEWLLRALADKLRREVRGWPDIEN